LPERWIIIEQQIKTELRKNAVATNEKRSRRTWC